MNDLELKLGLAKLLPDRIWQRNEVTKESVKHFPDRFFWKDTQLLVKDTEWLHICHVIEQNLTNHQHYKFCKALIMGFPETLISEEWISASWQQRAAAALKIIPTK